MSTRYRKVKYIEHWAFPMPNDVLPADWTVIASVWYREEPPEMATVIILTPQSPYYLVAFYFVANGEISPIGQYYHIAEAVAAYAQNGGDL